MLRRWDKLTPGLSKALHSSLGPHWHWPSALLHGEGLVREDGEAGHVVEKMGEENFLPQPEPEPRSWMVEGP